MAISIKELHAKLDVYIHKTQSEKGWTYCDDIGFTDVEDAYRDGYRQAEKDIEEKIKRIFEGDNI